MKLQGSSPGPQKPVIRPHVEPANISHSACARQNGSWCSRLIVTSRTITDTRINFQCKYQ